MQRGDGVDVPVRFEDQQNINSFGRLNNRLHELEDRIADRKRELEDLEFASDELVLADDGDARFRLGGCFVHMDNDAVEQRLSASQEEIRSEVGKLETELAAVRARMDELRKELYGRFGSAINLEEDKE